MRKTFYILQECKSNVARGDPYLKNYYYYYQMHQRLLFLTRGAAKS